MSSSTRAVSVLAALLSLLSSPSVHAQRAGDGGRFGDVVEYGDDDEYEEYRESRENPLSYYGSGCACLVLILLVAGLTSSAAGRSRGRGPSTPAYDPAEEARQRLADLEADELEEIFGDGYAGVRSQAEIVADVLASGGQIEGSSMTESDIATLFQMVTADELMNGPKKYEAQVINAPSTLTGSNSDFTPGFEGHVGTYLFGVSIIDARKAATLYGCLDAGNGFVNTAIPYRMALRAPEPLTVTRPTPRQSVVKGETLDVILRLARDRNQPKGADGQHPLVLDETGNPIIEVQNYSVRPAIRAGAFRRPAAAIGGQGGADEKGNV